MYVAASGRARSMSSSSTSKGWWTRLPKPVDKPDPHYEERKAKGKRRRGPDFNFTEKRLMLAYLIVKEKIQDGTSSEPWRSMHQDGHMRKRSIEALNNQFRKVLQYKIKNFGLTEDIVKQFVSAREAYQNSPRAKK